MFRKYSIKKNAAPKKKFSWDIALYLAWDNGEKMAHINSYFLRHIFVLKI